MKFYADVIVRYRILKLLISEAQKKVIPPIQASVKKRQASAKVSEKKFEEII